MDANILKQVAPSYPVLEKNNDIIGEVEIHLTVSSSGTPTGVIVSRSSQDINLDTAAAQAASATAFTPARKLGAPVARNYRLRYSFQLAAGVAGGHELSPQCGVTVSHVYLDGFDRASKTFLYSIAFAAEKDTIQSITLDTEGGDRETIAFAPSDWSKNGAEKYSATASFVMHGTPLSTVALHNVAGAGNGNMTCAPLILGVWDNSYGMWRAADLQAFGKNAPVLHGIEMVRPAKFAHRVWAGYPTDAPTSAGQARAVVLLKLDKGSKPAGAMLVGSTGDSALDAAAVTAALASTYAHTGDDATMYEAWYGFESHVPGQQH